MSGILDVRLVAEQQDGGIVQEVMMFAGPPVARSVAPEEVVRERDALKAEVEQLKQEIEKLRRATIRGNASRKTP